MKEFKEESFADLYEESLKDEKKLEKIVTGKIISISSEGELYVDIDYKSDGIIPKAEYEGEEGSFNVGDEITAMVVKSNDGFGNVLLSYKKYKHPKAPRPKKPSKAEREEQINSFFEKVEVGQKFEGTVVALSSYGAFVDIGGVQGLLHVSEMSWDRNTKPEDVVKEGDKIEVEIIDVDKENHRIKLGSTAKGPNPWENIEDSFKVDDIVNVKITKIMPFGAFAEIKPGVEGLIHISQLSDKRINKPEEVVKEGQQVDAKIITIDKDAKRIELSMKVLEEAKKIEESIKNE